MRLLPRGRFTRPKGGARGDHLAGRRRRHSRVVRRTPLLDESFHPEEVRVHFALRVGAEESGQSMTDRPAYGVIAHLDMNSRAALMNRLEMYDAAMAYRRARQTIPCQQLVRDLLSDLSGPFNRQARRPGDYPMRTAITRGPRLAHVGHEPRKVPVIGPETEDLLDRRVDIDRLLHLDRSAVATNAEKGFYPQVGGAAHEQAETSRAERGADQIAPRQAIGHQRAAGQPR